MNITRPLILGIAAGHSAAQLRPFVVSLRRTGYTGEVCLFVDRLDSETLHLLDDHGVRLQVYPHRHFKGNTRHLFRAATRLLPRELRGPADMAIAPYYLHLNDARWAIYHEYLRVVGDLYSHVMFSDVRDVIFQRHPFDFDWKAAFCTFCEPPGAYIKDEPHNRFWIQRGFGGKVLQEIGSKRIVCNGVSFAEIGAAREYVRLMAEQLIRINSRGVMDQGVHNFLVHRNELKSVHVYEIDETPVMHLGLCPAGKLPVNADGWVVNGSGRVANVIHQYAKHPIQPAPGSY